jgi:hypothetical protein
MTGDAAEHYERLAARFDENWAYSPEFVAWMTGCIVRRLDPQPSDQVADRGSHRHRARV